MELPEDVRLVLEQQPELRDGKYVFEVPEEYIQDPDSQVFRIVGMNRDESPTNGGHSESRDNSSLTPPVKEGDIRSVTIENIGSQGDGIAKVERGFVVIVPGSEPGEQLNVRITDVKDTVAFAEPTSA